MAKATNESPAGLPPQFKSWGKDNYKSVGGRVDEPSIGITTSGAFILSGALSSALGLKKGSGVEFLLDATKEQWYLERDDKTGIPLREDSKGCLIFNSTALYRAMKEHFPEDVERGRAKVVTEPERIAKRLLYPVLTATMRPSERKRKG